MKKIVIIGLALSVLIAAATGCSSAKPLNEYEVNKEYKFDITGDGKADSFIVETDGNTHFGIMVNGHAMTLDEIAADLAFSKYKLVKIGDGKGHAFALYVSSPPNEEEIYFYEFKSPANIIRIGRIAASDIAFKDALAGLSATQVKIGKQIFKFSDFPN